MRRWMVLPVAVFTLACGAGSPAEEPLPSVGDRAEALAASTEHFSFYNGFWVNLHDVLYWRTSQEDSPHALVEECFAGLPPSTQEGWNQANSYYAEEMADRHHRTDSVMVAVRYRLSALDHGEDDGLIESLSGPVLDVLEVAAPAYMACGWPQDSERNRAWIQELVPMVESHGDAIAERLSEFYERPWPMGIPVDVVSFASWAGANTIVAPNHVQMSSVDSGYQGLLALEMVFHETSHTTMGGVRERIAEASEALGVPVPNGLWHQVLFMTSGEVTRQVLAEANVSDFTAYMYENGLFRRAHERLEAHWLPHLHGERGVEEAMLGLVEAASR